LRLEDDHESRLEPNYQLAWQRLLSSWNLLQFHPEVRVVTSSQLQDLVSVVATPETMAPPVAATTLSSLADPSCHPVLTRCEELGLAAPVVGFELLWALRVVADAELAWPDKKVAVLLFDDEGTAFEAAGWRWFLPEEVEKVVEVLQGE
jgi:DEAD/DEAH box helicase domain-containing protein